MEQHTFLRYFRVFKNETAITEVSSNDFLPVASRHFENGFLTGNPIASKYSLPVDDAMFYGYGHRSMAMAMAKMGALKHIELLITQGEAGKEKLLSYRQTHYDDLNINLLDSNIKREKSIEKKNRKSFTKSIFCKF